MTQRGFWFYWSAIMALTALVTALTGCGYSGTVRFYPPPAEPPIAAPPADIPPVASPVKPGVSGLIARAA